MFKIMALLITLVSGLLFLLGILIAKKVPHKNFIYKFSSALAFSVIILLLIIDIMPEIWQSYQSFGTNKKIIYSLSFILMGIIFLKLLDTLVPTHHHEHHDDEKNFLEHNQHLLHIGLITSIALIIHNIIEGMAIYSLSFNSLKLGIIAAFGVGLHNIPMGIEIALSFDLAQSKTKNKTLTYLALAFSPLVGAIVLMLFNNVNEIILGSLMSITAGMLIYISFFELFGEIENNIISKETILGLLTGIILMVLTIFV